MARKARGGSSGRNLGQQLHHGSKTIWISGLIIAAVAAAGVGIGLHKRTEHETSALPVVNATAAKPMRASPEALEILTQLRNRHGSVSQRQISSDTETAEPNSTLSQSGSPLLPGLIDDFEADPAGILARFPAANGKPDAKVVLPSHANAAFELQAIGTGMRVQVQLEGAQGAAAEVADGYAVYRQALGPNTTVMRRAMPNGSEDFVSYAEAPKDASVSYRMTLDSSVAGLRLVSNTLELLDSSGTPRLRVAPPYIVSADGSWVEAKLALNGCATDSDPSDPWGGALTAPASQSCQLRVTWDNDRVEYPALLDPTWMTTGSMATARQAHTATLLSTGKVLVAGGTNGSTALATAELYDRVTGTWAATGSMIAARQWHTAVQLATSSNPTTSGKVLIAGGRNNTASLNTAQLYSPSAGTWVAAGNLNAARQQHTATLLPSGKILVTGGINGTTLLATAATYDPSSSAGTWTATTGPMASALKFHSASLLSTTNAQLNGKVLICGGNNGTASKNAVYLYDPAQLAFSTLANMPTAREGQTATLLSNTKVLLAGGKNGTTTLSTAVLFDPSAGPGSWSTTGNMTAARQGHSASLLSNGQVLVAGGSNGSSALSSAELFNGISSWTATTAMPAAVRDHTATALANGVVLVAGGLSGTTTQSAARLYDVTGGNTCTSGAQCQSGNCVSGVCCNSTCTDQCLSCSLPGLIGICSPKANGTACSDGNACTQSDTCQSGACAGANPVTCTALDQCHGIGTCNTITGACSNPTKVNGSSCSDGNACTQTDTCQSGACAAGSAVTCVASDACHLAGTCNTGTGTCSNLNAPDGTACSDNDACTERDQCVAGSCQAGAAVSADDGDACTVDSCNVATGVRHVPNTIDAVCAQWYSGGLQLKVLTNSCSSTQVTQSLQVTNTGADAISLSDIKVKFWVNDTSGSDVAAQVLAAGCVTSVSTFPSCSVQVTAATTNTVQFDACGPDFHHRANRELTVGTSDSAQLAPGQIWNDLQISVQLANGGGFTPGTSSWYSPCLTGADYAADSHFGVYYKEKLVYSAGINAPDCRGPHGVQRLSGYLTPDIINTPLVAPVPLTTPIHFSIRLPARIPPPSEGYPSLPAFVKQVSDPASPKYRQYLTPAGFAVHYGPTVEDYNALGDWAPLRKLTVETTWTNRLMLNIVGTAAEVEQALYVNLNYRLRPDGTQFYALDRDPSLDLTLPIAYVGNLENFQVQKTAVVPVSSPVLNANANNIRAAYAPEGCPSRTAPNGLTGAGECIGIYAPGDVRDSDLIAYANDLGIDRQFSIAQVSRIPPRDPNVTPVFHGETVLDAEMVMSMAPGAEIVLYFTNGAGGVETYLQRMASDDGHTHCSQLSSSGPNPCDSTADNFYCGQLFPAQGQSVFNASGDHGAQPDTAGASYNNSLTLVGGTTLTMSGANWGAESAWFQSGGGNFKNGPKMPDYQIGLSDVSPAAANNQRSYPDVAMVAWDISIERDSAKVGNGGTSAAAPLWAGFMALVNQQNKLNGLGPVGFLNPVLYAIGMKGGAPYTSSFHDITNGLTIANMTCGGTAGNECDPDTGTPTYQANARYDLTTGWGSPTCGLIALLSSPSPVPNLAVAAGGNHTCAIVGNGDIYCWGQNDVGQLGNGSTVDAKAPVPVLAPPSWASNSLTASRISSGSAHTCATMSDRTIWCWGSNDHGQLGDGTTTNSFVPAQVLGFGTNAKAGDISAGAFFTCASYVVASSPVDLHAKCWGDNSHGQLGNGTCEGNSTTPVSVTTEPSGSELPQVVSLSAGTNHVCADTSGGGGVQCWGDNTWGQLGNSTIGPCQASPVRAGAINDAGGVDIATGASHTCTVDVIGDVWCVGDNSLGQLGDGTTNLIFEAVNTINWFMSPDVPFTLTAGVEHTCANVIGMVTSNHIECWGNNSHGQLGNGTSGSHSAPVVVSYLNGIPLVRASAGNYHTCAVTKTGAIACWGSNSHGQLGDRSTTDRYVPATVLF